MTKITEKNEIDALADNDLLYVRDASDPSNPDKKMLGSKLRIFTADLSTAPVATPADDDRIGLWDVSDGPAPRKHLLFSAFRPAGAKVTQHLRFAGNIAIPAMAAGVENDATIAVAGAAVGDHAVFNIQPPANIAVLSCWVSAADVLTVRFRNLHASSAYAGGNVSCVALVSRSTA